MEDKSLADKAINLKGKQYVMVADRVLYFNEAYEDGCIVTTLLSRPEDSHVVIQANVYPDGMTGTRRFVGHSQAVIGEGMVNKTAALENAETSAVGRALAFMGIGVIESIASSDEINKAQLTKPTAIANIKPIPTERPKGDARKAKIVALLQALKAIPDKPTALQCKAAVEKATGLDLSDETQYDSIITRLEGVVEMTDPTTN